MQKSFFIIYFNRVSDPYVTKFTEIDIVWWRLINVFYWTCVVHKQQWYQNENKLICQCKNQNLIKKDYFFTQYFWVKLIYVYVCEKSVVIDFNF